MCSNEALHTDRSHLESDPCKLSQTQIKHRNTNTHIFGKYMKCGSRPNSSLHLSLMPRAPYYHRGARYTDTNGEWRCARPGCEFQHQWKAPGSTRNCCRACNEGEQFHTNNCCGSGQRVVGVEDETAHPIGPSPSSHTDEYVSRPNEEWRCARPGCEFQHQWKAPGSTRNCCQACYRGDQFHTHNCGGIGCRVVGVEDEAVHSIGSGSTLHGYTSIRVRPIPTFRPTFRVKIQDTCQMYGMSVTEYITLLASRYSYALTPAVVAAWQRTQWAIDKCGPSGEEVKIHVFKKAELPPALESICIDVDNQYRLNGYSNQYDLGSVTGVHPNVQAKLVSQAATANAICSAVIQVEMGRGSNMCKVAFSCTGGTHRSLGCACLLASLAYPSAIIMPTSDRTVHDAQRYLCPA